MFSSSSSNFNRNLEKATSQLLLEPDWDSVLQIVDSIRMGDVQSKTALQGIKKKISHENPHVAQFALLVLEACVKNCGSSFHNEVTSREFMEFLKDQAKMRGDPVKEKILELIQTWSHAFRNEAKYKAVEDCFHLLKMEGHKFPALKEADAMFAAEGAPQWKEGESCNRCRVKFGVMQRQHHCRNCGEVFCNKCSSKNSTIPKLGFEREVRVCDSCYDKINKTGTAGVKKEDDLPAEYLASPLSKQNQAPAGGKTEQEQQEEDELQLALALSKSEHETKEKERDRVKTSYGSHSPSNNREPSPAKAAAAPAALTAMDTSDMDPELARYLNRHYWQTKSQEAATPTTVPSAPQVMAEASPKVTGGMVTEAPQTVSSPLYQNGDTHSGEQEQFLSALQGSLEIFVNRMRSNSQRGRPIANDSAVQSLFAVISEMHPQLMTHINEKEEARGYYEGLQDKLTQLRDAREALDSLREEHREKKRREAEEMERQRQIQMVQKLEVMRQKKHEYLEMQRQIAMQRLQEQEREMQAREMQQRELTQLRQMQAWGYPQGYPQHMMGQGGMMPPQGMVPPQGYGPGGGGSSDGSPVHRMNQGPEGYHPAMQMLNQGGGMPPQSGMYSLGPQPPMGGQFMPPASMPPAGYQPDMPPASQAMMPPQGYNAQDQSAASMLPGQQSVGMYGAMPGPMSTASLPGLPSQPQMTSAGMPGMAQMDGQAAYSNMAPQPNNVAPFNMQGLSTALPQHPGAQPMYSNMPQQQPQQHQYPSQQQQQPQQQPQQQQQQQPQQQQQQPQQQPQQQQPYQQAPQQFIGQGQFQGSAPQGQFQGQAQPGPPMPGQMAPPEPPAQEPQLISFD